MENDALVYKIAETQGNIGFAEVQVSWGRGSTEWRSRSTNTQGYRRAKYAQPDTRAFVTIHRNPFPKTPAFPQNQYFVLNS